MSGTEPGLTPEDYAKLADMAANGVRDYAKHGGGRNGDHADEPDGQRVICRTCGHEWRTISPFERVTCSACGYKTPNPNGPDTPDGRGLTTPMCNAIREAAHDGLSIREITDLFTFTGGVQTTRRHAFGRCKHDDAAPTEPGTRNPYRNVDADECGRLRSRYDDGEPVTDLADATGRSKSTVYRHIVGECSHGGGRDG